jgi:hemolysin D
LVIAAPTGRSCIQAERADAFEKLLEHDAATKLDFLQAEQQRIDKTQELAGQRKKLHQDQSSLSEAEINYRALVSEFQQTKQAELSLLETKASFLVQDVTKAGQKANLQRSTTPIDGVVQQLAVHKALHPPIPIDPHCLVALYFLYSG